MLADRHGAAVMHGGCQRWRRSAVLLDANNLLPTRLLLCRLPYRLSTQRLPNALSVEDIFLPNVNGGKVHQRTMDKSEAKPPRLRASPPE
eukprot:scaffold554233_cov15-Prasinocladus_malaysianus.AAC.1